MSGGPDALEVITDFDHTLSKFSENGRRVPSSHGIMESYPDLSAEDHKYFRELYTKYYAIEICPDMSDEEKLPHMIEWWTRSHDRMVLAGFQKSVLAQTVDVSGVALRPVISRCGIACSRINAVYQLSPIKQTCSCQSTQPQGVLRGFSEPLIHTFNKRFSAFASSEASANDLVGATDRRHVLLMGDTMGDLRMSEGCNADLVLTVGYLNDRVQDRLSGYADKFDIVCLEDHSLCVPLAVIEAAATGGTA
uniref:5'-nucleotidase n=1 Tax=Macrostomum lignano TaxID=282301 RepID=A0A1I8HSP0_9PLAT